MTEPLARSLDDLIEEITTWPVGMPVRAMEQVLAMGEPAVPALIEALARFQDDQERDLLWPAVLLGELRHPSAVAPLIAQMRRTDLDSLALAATEALAKIGAPAVPALIEVATAPDPLLRLYAYGGLGWIRDDRAYAALLDALGRDRDLGEVLALALSDQGRPEAIPCLYEAYRACEPWQRIEFEDVLRELHWGRSETPIWTRDWRLRYRILPSLGDFALGWVGICAAIRGTEEPMPERATFPPRSLEEIVKEQPEPDESSETCEECGAPIESPSGLPVCPETALGITMYQLSFLKGAREDGLEDLFDLFEELDDREWEQWEKGEPLTPTARARWQEELDELHMCRRTCEWLIEQGVEAVGPARARLLAEAARLADRFGDPDGLLTPARRPAARGPKVGRNDPCPCGSGRKYKRCCLKRDAERP
ncbi:MAG: HEAT repeat domain-containing protein [Candidatus Tectomicrobia bacterium]|uniref:HEAT repeat domain-containing protein n=1 Tax=Tectimicrobiota bacterium TaxID=2528274 RepID=A0A932GQ34_UNCTE|nr:HEAT repeat domain-containing protein [Candidatus Tectomicrobia bacterium]